MTLSIAVVGAGPAGLYAADAVLRKAPGARVDVIEKLPTPFGLVRAGVAPDHQNTKAVARVLGRIAGKPGLRILGNVAADRDLSVGELRDLYDAVILACGVDEDRRLGIPGEDKAGVFGSLAFVGWLNSHPDHQDLDPDLGVRSAVIIGNGNVAIDVARILARTPAELAASDISREARRRLGAQTIREIHVVGRKGPAAARFTNPELAELGRLEGAVPLVEPAALRDVAEGSLPPMAAANLATLREFSANRADARPVRLRFHFRLRPAAFSGAGRVTGLRLESSEGGPAVDLEAGLVVTCIGYRCRPLADVPYDEARGTVLNDDGRVAPGLYAVGWAKRGPSGTIATNRGDSAEVVERLLADLRAAPQSPAEGPEGLDRLLAARNIRPVTYADWLLIDAAETSAARDEGGRAPRLKFTRLADMLAILQRPEDP